MRCGSGSCRGCRRIRPLTCQCAYLVLVSGALSLQPVDGVLESGGHRLMSLTLGLALPETRLQTLHRALPLLPLLPLGQFLLDLATAQLKLSLRGDSCREYIQSNGQPLLDLATAQAKPSLRGGSCGEYNPMVSPTWISRQHRLNHHSEAAHVESTIQWSAPPT